MKRYTKILGLGLGVLNSGTVLLLATVYPGTSPPFMLILGGDINLMMSELKNSSNVITRLYSVFYLQSFLPLPTPFGLLLSLAVLVLHVTLLFILQLRQMAFIRIELVRCGRYLG